MSRTVADERASIHGDLDRWHGEEYDRLKEMLDDLLTAHAHELAEQIREAGRKHSDPHGPYRTAAQMAKHFSDLIDPEVPTCATR